MLAAVLFAAVIDCDEIKARIGKVRRLSRATSRGELQFELQRAPGGALPVAPGAPDPASDFLNRALVAIVHKWRLALFLEAC